MSAREYQDAAWRSVAAERDLVDLARSSCEEAEEPMAGDYALLLHRIGSSSLSMGEVKNLRVLRSTSNPSYPVQWLVKHGYLEEAPGAKNDNRKVVVRATDKGKYVASVISRLFRRQGSRVPA